MYFTHFPVIPYDSVGDFNFKVVTNLLKRVAVRTKVKTNTLFFDTYDVKEGERPEDIADKTVPCSGLLCCNNQKIPMEGFLRNITDLLPSLVSKNISFNRGK